MKYGKTLKTLVSPMSWISPEVREAGTFEWAQFGPDQNIQPFIQTDPLPCSLEYDGTFRLLDGHHRCSGIARAGAGTVMLNVVNVSPIWLHFESELLSVYGGTKKLYQKINHPWFDDWKLLRAPARDEMIINLALKINSGGKVKRHTDIGCNAGALNRAFDECGFISLGLDFDRKIIFIADYIAHCIFRQTRINIYHTTGRHGVWELVNWHRKSFCIATCLSVLHHYIEGGMIDEYIFALKRLLAANILFIDHVAAGEAVAAKYLGFGIPAEPLEFLQWLHDKFGVISWKYMGIPAGDYRPLFAMSTSMEIE